MLEANPAGGISRMRTALTIERDKKEVVGASYPHLRGRGLLDGLNRRPLYDGPGLMDWLSCKPLYNGPGLSLQRSSWRPQVSPTSIPLLKNTKKQMQLRAGTLLVNQPGDLLEQEADRFSDQVMRMTGP